eukprot:6545057-Pyramimonas_sp.AAC.1
MDIARTGSEPIPRCTAKRWQRGPAGQRGQPVEPTTRPQIVVDRVAAIFASQHTLSTPLHARVGGPGSQPRLKQADSPGPREGGEQRL